MPHSNLTGAIARKLGYNTFYKHYYKDEYIAILPDVSKGNDFWQVYYKAFAVKGISNWFYKNNKEIEDTIVYQINSKNEKKMLQLKVGENKIYKKIKKF